MILFALLLAFHAACCVAMANAALRFRRDPDPAGIAWSDLTANTRLAGSTGAIIALLGIAGICRAGLAMLVAGDGMGVIILPLAALLLMAAAAPALGWRSGLRRRTGLMIAVALCSGLMAGFACLVVFLHG